MAKQARQVARVKVISRHRAECEHKKDGKAYVRCACPKALYWYAGGKEVVETAGTSDYQEAERKAHEKQAGFERVASGETVAEVKTVREIVNEYIQSKRDIGLDGKSVDKLSLLLGRLATFCEVNGLASVAEIKVTHLEKWRSSWTTAKSTNRKLQGYAKSFFEWAVNRDHAPRNEADRLEAIKDGGTKQKRALTDAQFQIALDALPFLELDAQDEAQFKALMLLQRWTGLAIQDAATIPRNKIKREADGFYSVAIRREKTGVDVYATINAGHEQSPLRNSRDRY